MSAQSNHDELVTLITNLKKDMKKEFGAVNTRLDKIEDDLRKVLKFVATDNADFPKKVAAR